MSRSGLLRAAALLAAGAAPLLVGSANAVEAPQLGGGVPEVGADKVLDATQHANPLDSAGALKLGHVQAPVAGDVQAPREAPAVQQRSVPAPLASDRGGVPALPKTGDLADTAHVGDLKAPRLSNLPANGVVPNPNVISGTLPAVKG
ncbi:hypothetical protein [Lentzea nigeriaca]|uniref:hypothetical protein n=1 Tax=Lentzea nigeriaca TaxID=1128665 RepID=UPI00195DF131|nr:hypothetical protein [Lentzea nigeriaca]MBM7862681.1 hypothetical protein [Lentzea nigeriaca]